MNSKPRHSMHVFDQLGLNHHQPSPSSILDACFVFLLRTGSSSTSDKCGTMHLYSYTNKHTLRMLQRRGGQIGLGYWLWCQVYVRVWSQLRWCWVNSPMFDAAAAASPLRNDWLGDWLHIPISLDHFLGLTDLSTIRYAASWFWTIEGHSRATFRAELPWPASRCVEHQLKKEQDK